MFLVQQMPGVFDYQCLYDGAAVGCPGPECILQVNTTACMRALSLGCVAHTDAPLCSRLGSLLCGHTVECFRHPADRAVK